MSQTAGAPGDGDRQEVPASEFLGGLPLLTARAEPDDGADVVRVAASGQHADAFQGLIDEARKGAVSDDPGKRTLAVVTALDALGEAVLHLAETIGDGR